MNRDQINEIPDRFPRGWFVLGHQREFEVNETRTIYGIDSFSPVSRFIKEIPEELIYEIRVASETEVKDKVFEPRIVGGTEHKVGGFSLGDRVEHKSFGEGVILNYEGEGSNARVEVNFDNGGTKWLVLSFANLEKI